MTTRNQVTPQVVDPQAPFAVPPEMAKVADPAKLPSSQQLLNTIKEELIVNVGDILKQEAEQVDAFLASIQPDIEAALAAGDVMSLNLIRGRIEGRLYRRSLKTLSVQSAKTAMTVMTVIRTAIRLAIV